MFGFSARAGTDDGLPPSEAAIAIVTSLDKEPDRWWIAPCATMIRHDSGIVIDAQNYQIHSPFVGEEPDANYDLLRDGIDRWISRRLQSPRPPEPDAVEPTAPAAVQ